MLLVAGVQAGPCDVASAIVGNRFDEPRESLGPVRRR